MVIATMNIISILMRFIQLVSQFLNISEVEAALIVGVVLAVIVGAIAFLLGWNGKIRRAAYMPMQAVTAKTPFELVRESRMATVRILFIVFFLFVLACGCLYVDANQRGEAQIVNQVIQNLVRSFSSP